MADRILYKYLDAKGGLAMLEQVSPCKIEYYSPR